MWYHEKNLLPLEVHKKIDKTQTHKKHILKTFNDNWGKCKGGLNSEGSTKSITRPKFSSQLAELVGIILGDGNVHVFRKSKKIRTYMLRIAGDFTKDRTYLSNYVFNLCKHLFGINPKLHYQAYKNEMFVILHSKKVVNFLNEIASIINSHSNQPAFCNTWGDGLFLVYDDIEVAVDVALHLRDKIKEKDWVKEGLPRDTNIRIGMHAGPVYAANDPIIKKVNYYGTHVNRAARIEPVTTPGSIFISEQTACLLTLTNNKNFICDYLGPIDLAKKYGTGVLYRLRRNNEIE